MKAAQVVHMSTVEKNIRKCTTNATSEKVEFFGSLTSQRPNFYWYLREHGPSTKKNKLASGEQPVPKLKQEKPACASRWLKMAQAGREHPWPAPKMEAMLVLQSFTFDIFIYVRL